MVKIENGISLQKADILLAGSDTTDSFVLKASAETAKCEGILSFNGKHFEAWVPEVVSECEMMFILLHDGKEISRFTKKWYPQKRWEVYFVPVTHTDYGYTQAIDELMIYYDRYLDSILSFCDATDSYPFEAKYRYTLETLWPLLHYLENCSPEKKNIIKRYIKDGRIEVSALLCNVIDTVCNFEELHRTLYNAAEIAEEYEAEINSASIVDIRVHLIIMKKNMAKVDFYV